MLTIRFTLFYSICWWLIEACIPKTYIDWWKCETPFRKLNCLIGTAPPLRRRRTLTPARPGACTARCRGPWGRRSWWPTVARCSTRTSWSCDKISSRRRVRPSCPRSAACPTSRSRPSWRTSSRSRGPGLDPSRRKRGKETSTWFSAPSGFRSTH